MTETMKALEAIGQLKVQEDRIQKALMNLKLVAANRISAKKVDGMTPEEFKKNAQSTYDSAYTIISRYIAMKEAINNFNASTVVNVCGEKMTVASALYLKNYGINQKKELLGVLTQALNIAKRKMQDENNRLDDAAERHAKQSFEGDPKTDKSEYLKFIDEFRERNQYVLVDPIDITEKIKTLEEEIANFEASVDTAIQIANATNDITFEY